MDFVMTSFPRTDRQKLKMAANDDEIPGQSYQVTISSRLTPFI